MEHKDATLNPKALNVLSKEAARARSAPATRGDRGRRAPPPPLLDETPPHARLLASTSVLIHKRLFFCFVLSGRKNQLSDFIRKHNRWQTTCD